ncbi:uncharacterized protein LOC141812127 [Curcuma longa]|uniref:uncharacterized protein LOC141812127 n=1 Tax=Curcuma longa TaxID=136217 RepID=UPI003D9FA192
MSVILGRGDGTSLCFLAGLSIANSSVACSSDAVARSVGVLRINAAIGKPKSSTEGIISPAKIAQAIGNSFEFADEDQDIQ